MDFTNILFIDVLYNDIEIDLLLSIYGVTQETINKEKNNKKFVFNKE